MMEKKKREPTAWNLHVMDYRKKHPELKFKDVLILAKETYVKKA